MLKTLKTYKYPYLFILPFFILFLVFQLIPTIWTIAISFTEWNGIGKPTVVGLENYLMMLKDQMFIEAFLNTIVYWVTAVFFILSLSILIGMLLTSSNLKSKSFFKTITFLPNVCAGIAMGLIFRMLFDENVGLVNEIFVALGFGRLPWLTSTSMSKIPVIILNIWRNTPWFTMIIISGLLNISKDYYEAARVDGAGIFRQFFYITLPSLGNILFFCFITLTVDSWKIFNEPFILPGPGTSNTSLFQYMYQNGFTIFKMGYSAAIGCILILILLGISLIQFAVRKKQGEI
ncbi:permease component of ABC-type sugar transporter [Sphaerochaeta pleomorpha str. Grapes]|uniref:Permease component of ABC-type sugar transporter n=1 Tax=Sphaerochaeta pleomorpha (strain ATCC BAA-1885 / DSM 22778 / Grapes) TaxID=158190 RepID=G8QTP9_SPHPG|nr:sugar ABC transporter permease [Sphaerochaeta pleomorpha]AEV28014.1 permease component of ABC-type sugar transporter [Sphaerochaeta pleomorpha str. Grapes]